MEYYRWAGDQPLDKLMTKPGVEVRFNSPVAGIRMSSKSQAEGVTCRNPNTGDLVDIDAGAVILCGGAFESPKLLLNSTSAFWRDGIGNDNGLVGRFLSATQFFYATGRMENPMGLQEELGFPSLCSRAFDSADRQKSGKLFMTMNYETPNLDVAKMMASGATSDAIRAARVALTDYQLYGNMSVQFARLLVRAVEPEQLRPGGIVPSEVQIGIELKISLGSMSET